MHARVVGDLVVAAVVHHDDVLDGLEAVDQRPEELQQRAIDEDDLVLGMVGDVDDVVREQPDIQGVQDAPAARCREVELEVARGVPGERPDAAVGGDLQRVEHAGQPARALGPLAVGRPHDPVAWTVAIPFSGKSRSARRKTCVSVSG